MILPFTRDEFELGFDENSYNPRRLLDIGRSRIRDAIAHNACVGYYPVILNIDTCGILQRPEGSFSRFRVDYLNIPKN